LCRLLGYVAARPTSVEEVLGKAGLQEFTALTAVHGDGWGMAWQESEDRPPRSIASPDSAHRDATYARLAASQLGRAGLVHLRWATPGLTISPENTHPFVDGHHAFAHNGHISPIDTLEDLLSPESRSQLRGDTDSERYFRFVLQCIAECGDDEAGVSHALGVLVREFPDASLNALMLSPRHLFAVHVNSRAAPPPALQRMGETATGVPPRHDDEYFAMDYRLTPDAVHVISSGLDQEGWTPVPEDTAVKIDLETRAVERVYP
jgi:predicted glutamine amidotransferase